MYISEDERQQYIDTISEQREELRELRRERDLYYRRYGCAISFMSMVCAAVIIYYLYELVRLFN